MTTVVVQNLSSPPTPTKITSIRQGVVTLDLVPKAGWVRSGIWSLSCFRLHIDKLPKGRKGLDPVSRGSIYKKKEKKLDPELFDVRFCLWNISCFWFQLLLRTQCVLAVERQLMTRGIKRRWVIPALHQCTRLLITTNFPPHRLLHFPKREVQLASKWQTLAMSFINKLFP